MLIQKAAELHFPLLPGTACNIQKKERKKEKTQLFYIYNGKKGLFWTQNIKRPPNSEDSLTRKLSSWMKSVFIAQEIEKGR